MNESLKDLFENEEEAITVFQEYKKFGCKTCKISSIGSCSGEEEATSCWIQFCKEAGIIRKSARQEFLEHLNVMKNADQVVEQDFIDLLDLFHKAEAEKKSKE